MITCWLDKNVKTHLRHVVMDAIIVEKGKIMLTKRASFLSREPGKWTLPGGYLDQQETIEQGLLREIKEETGYLAKLGQLFRIVDDPQRDRGNVSFIFLAKIIKKIGKPDKETSELKWFDLNMLPEPKMIAFDHKQTIQLFKKYLKKSFPLPVFKDKLPKYQDRLE